MQASDPIEQINGVQFWDQNRNIDIFTIINPEAVLTIGKGVEITFSGEGALFVAGNLVIDGTVKNPVKIRGINGYNKTLIFVENFGKADFRNAEFIADTSAVLMSKQNAISVNGGGILEMEACKIYNNYTGIKLSYVYGANIKVNRSKFFGNVVAVDNSEYESEENVLPDFSYNWWGSVVGPERSPISGDIDSSDWIRNENFHDPVIIVPGIALSEKEFFGLGEWKIDPILHTYDNLIETFQANGYIKDKDLFVFPYDWRKSNVDTAQLLRDKINAIKSQSNGWPKVDIVAHSMGGLTARQYIEFDDYQGDVDQLVTLATPQNGASASYLTWEDGSFDPKDVFNYFSQKHFSHLAEKDGYGSIFDYIHEWPASSVEELLPVYDYLYDADNNGQLRVYPQNYPVNLFLQKLNSAENIEKLKNVEFDKIIAVDGTNTNTITGYIVEKFDWNDHWVNGKPIKWDNLLQRSQGIIRGVGDNTVPLESAKSDNIATDENLQVNSNHLDLVTKSQAEVFEFLNDYPISQEVTRWHIPDLLDIMVHSPVDIQVIAPDGKRVGKDFPTGQILNEIEGAFYSGYGAQAEFITIPNPLTGEYKILAQGTGAGNYEIEAARYRENEASSEIQETVAMAQGIAAVGQGDEVILYVQPSGEVIIDNDFIPPAISISSPAEGKSYLNDKILPITYLASDNKSDSDKIAVQLYLDNATTTVSVVDLAFQKTGGHSLKIAAQDEAGNAASTEVRFSVFATVDSTAANAAKFAGLGMIKKSQAVILTAQLKALKVQFAVLDKLKTNNRISAKAKSAGTKVLETVINKQIDLLIKEIQKMSGKGVDANTISLFVDALKYIRIK